MKASIIIYDPFLLDITGDTAVPFISAWVTETYKWSTLLGTTQKQEIRNISNRL